MATRIRRDDSPRRPTNVSLPAATVAAAKELGINLSQACEAGLAAEVHRERVRRWQEENRPAMEEWNRWLETNGMPFADLRIL